MLTTLLLALLDPRGKVPSPDTKTRLPAIVNAELKGRSTLEDLYLKRNKPSLVIVSTQRVSLQSKCSSVA